MWRVRRTGEGFVIYFKGQQWSTTTFPTAEIARAYIERLKGRYSEPALDLLLGQKKKQRIAGPYEYELPDGDWHINQTGIIPATNKSEARRILASWLERRRLPAGTKVEQQED